MLPNAKLVGLAVRVPKVTPAPDTGIFRVAFVPLLVTEILPAKVPAAVGEYVAVKVVL